MIIVCGTGGALFYEYSGKQLPNKTKTGQLHGNMCIGCITTCILGVVEPGTRMSVTQIYYRLNRAQWNITTILALCLENNRVIRVLTAEQCFKPTGALKAYSLARKWKKLPCADHPSFR